MSALKLIDIIDAKYSGAILSGKFEVLHTLSGCRRDVVNQIRMLYSVPLVAKYLDSGNVKKVRELLGLGEKLISPPPLLLSPNEP